MSSEHSHLTQQIATYPNLSFYFEEKITDTNSLADVLDIYTNVTIISHEKYASGKKYLNYPLLLHINLKNNDGSLYQE